MARQVGIRMVSNEIDKVLGIAVFYDFIQVLPEPDAAIEDIKRLKKLNAKFVIHLAYYQHGVDLSIDAENNEKGLYIARKSADVLGAEHIVIHAGVDGTVEGLEANLKKYGWDKRYLVENIVDGNVLATAEDIRKFCDKWDINSCFDFGHAIARKNKYKGGFFGDGYLSYCENFINILRPKVVHLYGGHIESKIDQHLHLEEGNFNINAMLGMIPKDAIIILEIPKLDEYKQLKKGVELVKGKA